MPTVLLFLKFPEPGRVKTRLAKTVGAELAAAIYQRLVAAVIARVPGEMELVGLFDPPEKAGEVEQWMRRMAPERSLKLLPQAAGDLGRRLDQAFADAFAAGAGRVLVIGSDCVELDAAIFAEAGQALADCDLVVGPSEDGGYYLIGLQAPHPELFTGIDWSTRQVLAQTLVRAERARLRVHLLPKLPDVDTEEDWRRAESRLQ
ncbi:MAG: TIGR04282 family arsenosugar biosynthesis glycosyltransferase [Verrucomicrobiota bacterium]|nr:TIGR04282 family arsenosugar biosynthesis glycosyltransferase [Verrucomicrobiota bacterium]